MLLEPKTTYLSGHRRDEGIDPDTGVFTTYIHPCRRISCHRRECREAIARETAAADKWIARQQGHSDLITINRLPANFPLQKVSKALQKALQNDFKKGDVRLKIVVEPHKSGLEHIHAELFTTKRLNAAQRTAIDIALRPVIPADSEIHHAQRAAADTAPAYLTKELVSHPAQHRERNPRGAYAAASQGFFKTAHTADTPTRRRQQAARLENDRARAAAEHPDIAVLHPRATGDEIRRIAAQQCRALSALESKRHRDATATAPAPARTALSADSDDTDGFPIEEIAALVEALENERRRE